MDDYIELLTVALVYYGLGGARPYRTSSSNDDHLLVGADRSSDGGCITIFECQKSNGLLTFRVAKICFVLLGLHHAWNVY